MILALCSFITISILSFYIMLSGNWVYFMTKLKWFLRIATPLIIVFLFYLNNKWDSSKDL